jgi:hypothetical protein
MAKDPAFYKKFSRLLEDVIEAYHAGRLQALEAFEKIKDISTKVVTHTDEGIPDELIGNDMARRYYGCVSEPLVVNNVIHWATMWVIGKMYSVSTKSNSPEYLSPEYSMPYSKA